MIDNSKAYVRAELTLARQTVSTKAAQAGPAVAMIVAAILLLQAALTVLAAALGLLLARWLGAAGGLGAAALIVLALAGLLVWIAVHRFQSITK